MLTRAAECGATAAAYVPLRLPGHVADVFLERLRERMPLHAKRVEQLVRDGRSGRLNDPRFGHRMSGKGDYWAVIRRLFETTATRLGFPQEPIRGQLVEQPLRPTAPPGSVQLPLFG